MTITAQVCAFTYPSDVSVLAEADIDIPGELTKVTNMTSNGEEIYYRYDLNKSGVGENLARWLESVAAEIRREYG